MKIVFYVVLVVVLSVAVIFGLCLITDYILPIDDAKAMTIDILDNGIVGDNLMPNVDFSSDRASLNGTDYRTYGYTFGGWYFNYNNSVYNVVLVRKDTSNTLDPSYAIYTNGYTSRTSLHYDFPSSFFHSNTTYTFTFGIDVVSASSFGFSIDLKSGNSYNSGFGGINVSSYDSGLQFYSYTFTTNTIDPDSIYSMSLKLDAGGILNLYYSKLEIGSSFTGFVPRYYENFGYKQGFADAKNFWVSEVESYLNGNVIYGAFFDYNDQSYSNVYLENGDSFNSPVSDFSGSGYLSTDYGGFGGLCFQNLTGVSSWTIREFEFNEVTPSFPGKYMCAFVLEAPTNTTVHFSGACFKDITFSDSLPHLVLLDLDVSQPLRFYLSDTNAYVNILKYLTVYSEYFTGWPVTGVDSNAYAQGYSDGAIGGFADGQSEGWSKGYEAGTNSGYNNGYTIGYGEGRITGYSDGLTDAGDSSNGSWYSLFTSIIDVPIKTITGFLDVQILGFNFLSLFRTLLLVSLFFFILKVLVGKYA